MNRASLHAQLQSRRRLGSVEAARHGFTLIEILIVISILALVLATGIPAIFRAVRKDPLRQAVSDVVEACSMARALAILGGASAEMVIVADGGAIRVERARPRHASDSREVVAGNEAPAPTRLNLPSRNMRLHDDVAVELLYINLRDQMKASEARVRFFPDGTSEEFAIVLHYQEQVRKIELDIVTGQADVLVIR